MSNLTDEFRFQQFEQILENYRPNKKLLDEFAKSNFVVIAGPSAAGKDTLRDGLLVKYPDLYEKVVSITTRPPRSGEIESEAYDFVTLERLKNMIEEKSLIQAAIVHNQQISAISGEEIHKIRNGKIGLSILVVQTEQDLYKQNPNIHTIFLIPPSYDDLLKRLKKNREIDQNEIFRRLKAAEKEIQIALSTSRYYCMVSDKSERTQELTDKFLRQNARDEAEDRQARTIMRNILEKLTTNNVS